MQELTPTPGSEVEITAFESLQARLPGLFRKVFADPHAPRTVVVVPGLSVDAEVLAKVTGCLHYEERQLSMLTLLRLPNTRLVFASSAPIEPAIVDYHLQLLPGVPLEDARRRLVLLSASDCSAQSLTQKILERPRLLARIRTAAGDPQLAHLSVFNSTALERTLAVQLGIPLYGCDARLIDWGSKSGSRRAFREAGIALPDGVEDLRDTGDLVAALAELRGRNPFLSRAVVKLNQGFSGEGNAVFSFAGCPEEDVERWVAAHVPLNLALEARDLGWERYAVKLREQGAIVESWITGEAVRSPSVQMRITPLGELEMISTHDQVLGGPSGQIFLACTFPAHADYALEIQALAVRVGTVLKGHGVLGRFGVDFVSVPDGAGWKHYAIEINLRKGGTTHTFQMLQFLTLGTYDATEAAFVTPSGERRCYYATDNVLNPLYRRLTPQDLFEIAEQRNLRWDPERLCGVTLGLAGAISQYGKLGMVAIDTDAEAAQRRFRRAVAVLDEEAAMPPAA